MSQAQADSRETRLFRLLGLSYEIRIRITLGFMFLLILIANLNSLRFFSQTNEVNEENLRLQTAQNLNLIAATLRTSPIEKLQTSAVRDLALAAGFDQLFLVETDLLRDTATGTSSLVSEASLADIRSAYARPKRVAGGVRQALPSTITESFSIGIGGGRQARYAFFHLIAENGQPLTLAAMLEAEVYSDLARFSQLNTLFQIISLLAASTIALILLKITFKPYQQIKSEAIAADVATPDRPESIDFAVSTFQKVIAELQAKEKRLQELYAQQKQRAASLERYNEYVLHAMPSGVISCDTDGRLTHFNTAAASILSIGAEPAIGKGYERVLEPFPVLVELITSTLRSGQANRITELQLANRAGERLWVSLNSSILRDSDGQPRGAMVLINNLTELKRLESAMMLREHMAALGEMSAGLAHQLRNSMGAIVGFAQLLNKPDAGGQNLEAMSAMILKEARTTGEMLDRFLRLSRPSELVLSEIDFKELASAIRRHFHQQLLDRQLRLTFTTADNLPALLADQVLLLNILTNLIQNAIHASTDGSSIEIAVLSDSQRREMVLSVSDHGYGIAPEELQNIFTPFYTSGKADGTGLGLALVEKWAAAHGGRIECNSVPGAGSRFTLHLPLSPEFIEGTTRQIALAELPH